jgi:PAS domain S-box-containing protein
LTALSLLSFWELQTHRNLEWIADMQGVAVDLQELTSLMREAEKRQRLYLLTGSDDDLHAYEEAASDIPEKISRLNTLTRDYAFPSEDLEHLAALAQARLTRLGDTIRLMEEGQSEAVLDLVRSDRGSAEEWYAVTRLLKKKAREALQRHLDQERVQDTYLRYIDLGGSVLAGSLIVAALLLVRHQARRRQHAEAALQESQQRFHRIASATSDALWEWNLTTDAVWLGEGHRTIFGYNSDAANSSWWVERIHPDDRGRILSELHAAFETGAVSWYGQYRYRRSDETYVTVADRAAIVRDTTGRPLKMFGGMVDITERTRADAQIHRLLEEAQARESELRDKQRQLVQAAKLASIGELATGVAHELNNPLNNIALVVGNELEKLRRGLIDPTRVEGELMLIQEQTHRAATIVRQLRTFAHCSSNARTPAVLRDVLASSMNLVRRQLELQNISVAMHLNGEERAVLGDPLQLEQVFVNLLTNARDAVATTHRKDIVLSTRVCADTVQICVTDSGVGIAPEQQERIFDPFFTTKEVGKGTGLGLSISHGIIQSHGGTISVESSPGDGTSVTVTLPLTETVPLKT